MARYGSRFLIYKWEKINSARPSLDALLFQQVSLKMFFNLRIEFSKIKKSNFKYSLSFSQYFAVPLWVELKPYTLLVIEKEKRKEIKFQIFHYYVLKSNFFHFPTCWTTINRPSPIKTNRLNFDIVFLIIPLFF